MTKAQKKSITDALTNSNYISVIVPSVNKNWPKTFSLTNQEYEELKLEGAKRLDNNNYCLLQDSNIFGDLLNTGYICLTKEQFDKLLKFHYNTTLRYTPKGKELKNVD